MEIFIIIIAIAFLSFWIVEPGKTKSAHHDLAGLLMLYGCDDRKFAERIIKCYSKVASGVGLENAVRATGSFFAKGIMMKSDLMILGSHVPTPKHLYEESFSGELRMDYKTAIVHICENIEGRYSRHFQS